MAIYGYDDLFNKIETMSKEEIIASIQSGGAATIASSSIGSGVSQVAYFYKGTLPAEEFVIKLLNTGISLSSTLTTAEVGVVLSLPKFDILFMYDETPIYVSNKEKIVVHKIGSGKLNITTTGAELKVYCYMDDMLNKFDHIETQLLNLVEEPIAVLTTNVITPEFYTMYKITKNTAVVTIGFAILGKSGWKTSQINLNDGDAITLLNCGIEDNKAYVDYILNGTYTRKIMYENTEEGLIHHFDGKVLIILGTLNTSKSLYVYAITGKLTSIVLEQIVDNSKLVALEARINDLETKVGSSGGSPTLPDDDNGSTII